MVGFDASIALVIWFPEVRCSAERAKERVEYLLEQLEAKRERILIPTPALSELLVRAGDAGAEFVNQLSRSSRFEIAPFDDLAAIEVALTIGAATRSGNKRGKNTNAHWAKVKFDHQIAAICKVHQVSTLFTDDPELCNFASSRDIHTVRLAELPLKPVEPTLFDGLGDLPNGGDSLRGDQKEPLPAPITPSS